ncbi:alkene reductase [Rugamonas sp.]|uniref:alkene reductase n=1 Tax=Rugamonas sp. TaxID=1926287 RepID=UPI0025ECBAF6|nr:alkene reductase [Rugamonas sp.]
MTTITALLQTIRLGRIELPNRIIMAPLTRMRAGDSGVPTAMNADYYAQRASAGLIITESTRIGALGHSYPGMPGIHTEAQIDGWKKVTRAVHARGGRIFLQIAHGGRVSYSSYTSDNLAPVAPSAVAPATGMAFTREFALTAFETPRALEADEIGAIVGDFRQAARNAMLAGFDGVEIHGANGYLIDQFLHDGSNLRTDNYGGSIENRSRFLLDVVDAIGAEIGIDRTAIRLSPFSQFNDMRDSDTTALFGHVLAQLSQRPLAYLHLVEARAAELGLSDELRAGLDNNVALFRQAFSGPVISAGGYTRDSAEALLAAGGADAVAFGRSYIANPDLVERLTSNAPLNAYDRATFYGGAEPGYLDYPTLEQQQSRAA